MTTGNEMAVAGDHSAGVSKMVFDEARPMKIRISSVFDLPASTVRDLKRLGLDRDAAFLDWIGCAPLRAAIAEEEPIEGRVELAAEFRMGFRGVEVLGEDEEGA